MHFVTFHSTTQTWHEVPHLYGGLRSPHSDLVTLFLASLRRWHSDCTVTLLTDASSSPPGEFDRVVRADFDQEELMLARFRMQRAFLANQGRQLERLVLLDTDILLNGSLNSLFDGQFDIGLTIRDQPMEQCEIDMPYNNGVIFVDCRRNLDGILDMFDELIARVERMPRVLHAWSGNQYAVRDLVGKLPVGATAEVKSALVRVLPCSVYNYTPRCSGEIVDERIGLHFKGPYKHLMNRYAASADAERPKADA